MLALVLTSSVAWAQAPRNATLQDFHHTAWTQKDGAPAGVWAMAQTRDGWLWLGTASGLYRFDGVHFERHDLLPEGSLASRSVGVLHALRNGDLWVGYSFGGASVLGAGGEVRHFAPGGLPEGKPVESFDEDGDGRAWAHTPQGLHVFEAGGWSRADARWGLPEDEWSDSLQDVSGALWMVGSSGVYVLRPGTRRFERVEHDGPTLHSLVLGHDGSLWRYDERGASPLRGPGFPAPSAHVPAEAWSSHAVISVFDRDGSNWLVGCPQGGICRVAKPFEGGRFVRRTEATDVFGAREGLSSDAAMTLFRDREGNVWVGTQLGVDRFRRNDVATLRFPTHTSYFALVADRQGRVWSGSAMRVRNTDFWWRLEASPVRVPGIEGEMTATLLDSDGRLLLGGSSGFWRFDPETGHVETLSRPEQEEEQRIQAIVRDAEGRLWVSFRASTVYRLDGETWTPKGGLAALPDLPPARAVLDDQGRLWFGYSSNQVVILEGAHVRSFTEAQGLRTGTVTAILPGETTLVGGALGLAAFDGARFRMLKATQAEVLTGLTGLVKTDDGALWLNGQAGGARIAAEDLRRALAEPDFVMPVERFDMNDGMPGGAQQIRPLPTLVRGADGRLWFAAVNGLGWMDPRRIERNALPPPVMIRSVSSGETSYAGTARLALPPRTRELRIAYTALSLGMPERVTFRYRLEGVDDGWKDAGARREATYTNLGPGHYRFQVMAANEDGVWNEQGASLEVDIAPTFFQTRAFAVLCVVGGAGLLWLLYALRMWRVTQRLRLRLEERHAERERIARELHDTLLQGIQGLVLNVHVVTSSLPAGDARLGLESALDRADSVLTEGRDRVSSLRDTSASKDDLAEAFTSLARELDEREGPRLRMVVRGEARTLEPLVADELYRIGREAIGNAFVHSQAREVEVSLLFEHPELRLCVRDDGRGIDVATLERGGRAGHWGLRGMRERAEKVGGRLDIISGEGRGTEIQVVVQAQRAYLRRPLEGLRRLVPRLGRR